MIGNPNFEALAAALPGPSGKSPTGDSSAHERPIRAAGTSNAY
jgi:hypothetical protein